MEATPGHGPVWLRGMVGEEWPRRWPRLALGTRLSRLSTSRPMLLPMRDIRRVAIVVLAVLAFTGASPYLSLEMEMLRNGRPVFLGEIPASSTSVTNLDAGQPFAIASEKMVRLECDTGVYYSIGASPLTVASALTISDGGVNVNRGALLEAPRAELLVVGALTTLAVVSTDGGSGTCVVFGMR